MAFEHKGARLDFIDGELQGLARLGETRAYLGQRYAHLCANPGESEAEKASVLAECVLAVCDLFDNLFGDGTANAVFGGEISGFDDAMNSYEALERYVEAENLEFTARVQKYLPEGNGL